MYERVVLTSRTFCTLATARHPVATAGWSSPCASRRISCDRTRYEQAVSKVDLKGLTSVSVSTAARFLTALF